jgi:GNAT superfamily N-acetyltransferase
VTTPGVAEIQWLPSAAADDVEVRSALTDLINDVYAVAENGLCIEGAARTSAREMSDLARAGELAVALIDGRIAGCVRIQSLSDEVGEFGLLAVAPDQRGTGLGRELVRFAEAAARDGHRRPGRRAARGPAGVLKIQCRRETLSPHTHGPFVLPTMIAPAAFSLATTVASAAGTCPAKGR